jgi:hypothetical protein
LAVTISSNAVPTAAVPSFGHFVNARGTAVKAGNFSCLGRSVGAIPDSLGLSYPLHLDERGVRMRQNDPAHDEAPLLPFDPHKAGCPRVWQDVTAEILLALAVALIAATGIDPLMRSISQLLGARAPRYDPVVWLLIAVPCIVAALVAASIQLKSSAKRQTLPEAAHYAETPYASALTWRRHIRQKV